MNGVSPLTAYKRFLDDIFMVWIGSHQQLHRFHREINTINPSIKFTIKHTKKLSDVHPDPCPCPAQDSIPFLDQISIGRKLIDASICSLAPVILLTVQTTSRTASH